MPNWGFPYRLQNGQVISKNWIEDFSDSIEYLKIDRPSGMVTAAQAGETYSGSVHKVITANHVAFITPKSPQAQFVVGANATLACNTANSNYQIALAVNGIAIKVMQYAAKSTAPEVLNIFAYVSPKEFDIAFELSLTWLPGGNTLTATSGRSAYIWWMEL